MLKFKICVVVVVSIVVLLVANNKADAQNVKWYSFEEAIELNAKSPRNIMIDVYTDWCGWCKVMDKQTFSMPDIAKILNEQYYAVKLDAETKDTIIFKEHTFVNTGEGKRPPHQLAIALLNGKLSYPNIVFLNKNSDLLGALPGFKKPEEMMPILNYITKELYKQKIDLGKYIQEHQAKQ
jgi:thioredoxin-related protein